MPTQCDDQLLCDNILDLTHADFLHAGSLGSGSLIRVKPQVDDLGERGVKIAWMSSGDLAAPAGDAFLRKQGQPTDQWLEVVWTAPGLMDLTGGATLQGEPRSDGMEVRTLHIATPEAPGRCHDWYWGSRNVAINAEANAQFREVIRHAFEEQDKPILEAQQQRLGQADSWSLKPVLLPGDAGAIRARRKLAALITAQA